MTAHQTFQLAMHHHRAGLLREAESLYRQVLAMQADHADAMNLLGVLLGETNRLDDGIALLERAVVLSPKTAHFHRNLGTLLAARGKISQAIEHYQKAIELRPNYPQAFFDLGKAYQDSVQPWPAIEAYRNAIALQPDFPEAQNNLGVALEEVEGLDDSIAVFGELLARRPEFPGAQYNFGNSLRDAGLLDESLEAYRTAMSQTRDPAPASRFLLTLWFHPNYDLSRILREHEDWDRTYAQPLRSSIPRHANDRSPERRLRVGYVSPDFRNHIIGHNVLPLLANHDHDQFEVFCYSNVPFPDELTDRFRQHSDTWRDTTRINDTQAAELVRADQIDILIDLSLHTAYNRLLLFARNPAPLQVTFAGYPATTGLRTIDYRLSDGWIDPVGVEPPFVEKTIRLPSFWCYQSAGEAPPANPLPALANGFITFGCLNNFCKVNDLTLDLWSGVLRRLPSARLLLRAPVGSCRHRVQSRMENSGIDSSRIDFVARQSWQDYMSTYHRIDLALDTFPYNGHTTTLDSLWMGVPPITLAGQTPVSRGGLSMLSNLALGERVCSRADQFPERAAQLAGDLEELSRLRRELRMRMQQSCLTDAQKFASGIEAAFRQMWRTWSESSRP